MTSYFKQAKHIASKPNADVTLGDLALLIAGFQRLFTFGGVLVAAYVAFHNWFGGNSGESPGRVQRALAARVDRLDSGHVARMNAIEDLAVIALGQNQQQSYQLCLLQPRAQATQCANILLENRIVDSLMTRRRRMR